MKFQLSTLELETGYSECECITSKYNDQNEEMPSISDLHTGTMSYRVRSDPEWEKGFASPL